MKKNGEKKEKKKSRMKHFDKIDKKLYLLKIIFRRTLIIIIKRDVIKNELNS